jgi:membrane protein
MTAENTKTPTPEDPGDQTQERFSDRVVDLATRAFAWTERYTAKAQAWADGQEEHSRSGVAVGWFARYRRADGQLFALLLAAYFFVTLLPAAIAMGSYAGGDPKAVAARVISRLHLTGQTATLTRDVLEGAGGHQLTATLIAVVSVMTFGLGIGRTLQLVYGRVWGIPATRGLVDQARYLLWLLVFLAGCLLYVMEEALLRSASGWIEWALAPLWVAAIVGLLAWSPVFLLHSRITIRDAMPGALLATAGLVGLRALSSVLFTNWLNWYSTYYGGIGIVMAIFFWLVLATSLLIITSALSPAYAVRRARRSEAAREAGAEHAEPT